MKKGGAELQGVNVQRAAQLDVARGWLMIPGVASLGFTCLSTLITEAIASDTGAQW